MTTPLKGLFSVMLTSPSLPVKNPKLVRRQTSWLFTKSGEFAPGITEDKLIQKSESGISIDLMILY